MKVNFGIHISDTSASIARMIDGQPTIIRTNTLEYKIPLCVGFNKRGNLIVGDDAYNALIASKIRYKNFETKSSSNYYCNFLRTIGTDKTYYFSNINKEYSSEQLLGFVIKTLKSFVKDNHEIASVITVPNRFNLNQIEAIKMAGTLGGLEQVETVQESIAASIAYGLDVKNKNGLWLSFDFDEETFEAALLKMEESIMKVIDTEGDNYLGGKNLDYAIVDGILISHIEENYTIDNILSNNPGFREALKFYAEEIKNQLSFRGTFNLYVDPGDVGEDDNGEEIEIDITVTQEMLEKVISPIFQKAIDLTKDLLERNNLSKEQLDSLILVGGPTCSPILRKMLEEQIIKPDTSVDPKTVVVKGAALYASRANLFNSNTFNKSLLIEVEDLLFKLLEDGKIDSDAFQKHFDVIFDIKRMNLLPDKKILNKIYKELENVAQQKI